MSGHETGGGGWSKTGDLSPGPDLKTATEYSTQNFSFLTILRTKNDAEKNETGTKTKSCTSL